MSLDFFNLLRHLRDRHAYVPQGNIRVTDPEYIKLMSKHSVFHLGLDKVDHLHQKLGRSVSWVVEEVTNPIDLRKGE